MDGHWKSENNNCTSWVEGGSGGKGEQRYLHNLHTRLDKLTQVSYNKYDTCVSFCGGVINGAESSSKNRVYS